MLVALGSLSAPPTPPQDEQPAPLLPGTVALASSGDGGAAHQCRCWASHEPKLVFYNRVPKCGSTTMLRYIDAASRRDGFSEDGSRRSFGFFSSADFNSDHFHPDRHKRHEILREMVRQSGGRAALFERHIHYLEMDDMDDLETTPAYVNLLRDPGTLRASSFYFARDCICNQRGGFMDSNDQWQLQDTWCQNEWYRKSDTLCNMDINECYEDRQSCHDLFPKGALGGTVMIDFLCGCVTGWPSISMSSVRVSSIVRASPRSLHASTVCVRRTDDVCGQELTPQKLQRAKDNLRDRYLWVGVLESMPDSLELLQKLLPDYFGTMNATYWGNQHVAPDGGDPAAESGSSPRPTETTLTKMREDSYLAAEYELYDFARDVLDCKLEACGLQRHGRSSATSFALES